MKASSSGMEATEITIYGTYRYVLVSNDILEFILSLHEVYIQKFLTVYMKKMGDRMRIFLITVYCTNQWLYCCK